MNNELEKSQYFLLIFCFVFPDIAVSAKKSQEIQEQKDYRQRLEEAEELYSNGKFEEAIAIYQEVIAQLEKESFTSETKNLIEKALSSLAFTYFTIQLFDPAEEQLTKLLPYFPEKELDKDFYPEKFLQIFSELQKRILATAEIITFPAGATIFIEDQPAGKTPLKIEKIAQGDYLLKIVLEGYETEIRRLTIAPEKENRAEIFIKQAQAVPTLTEKKQPEKKKKKSLLLPLAGGVLIAGAIAFIILKKKLSSEEQYSEWIGQPFNIEANHDSEKTITISQLEGKITSFSYAMNVDFPNMEELEIYFSSPDNHFQYVIWNRQFSSQLPTIIKGQDITAFNEAKISGSWKLVVKNSSGLVGEIQAWKIGLHYFPK